MISLWRKAFYAHKVYIKKIISLTKKLKKYFFSFYFVIFAFK